MTTKGQSKPTVPVEDLFEDVWQETESEDPEQAQDAIMKDSANVTPSSRLPYYMLASLVLLTLIIALITVFTSMEAAAWNNPKHYGDNGKGTNSDFDLSTYSCPATNLMCPTETKQTKSWFQTVSTVGEGEKDFSGSAVALSCNGSILAVGAARNDGSGNNAGHVRVYRLNGSTADLIGQEIEGAPEDGQFGTSVALSANGYRLAVGARYNDGGIDKAGHVRVFDYAFSEDRWLPAGDDIHGEDESDQSGRSISLSADGNRLAIGATFNNATGTVSGHTRVFEYYAEEKCWKQVGQDLDGENAEDLSGHAVTLSGDGNRLAVGAYQNDGEEDTSNTGHVRIFEYFPEMKVWYQIGKDIDGTRAYDWFGYTLAMTYEGDMLAVGAPGDKNNKIPGYIGYTAVFKLIDGEWAMVGSNKLKGGGLSVDISEDGNRVVVGSYSGYDNGIGSGQAIVYEFNGTDWNQFGSSMFGNYLDYAGTSVAISADGMRVVSSAPAADFHLVDTGLVRVYDFCDA